MLKRIIKILVNNKPLVLIVLLATLLRFAGISETPPSLNWDEVSHGYNAYSILKTGKDEWGRLFPMIFRAYGDYKLPVYIYATSVSVAIFGLNAFAIRLPSVLAGVVTVIFTYLLTYELFSKHKSQTTNHKPLAAIAALLVAVEPWSFFLSRGAFEANLALTFIVSGAYFFLKSFHTAYYILPSIVLFGLSVWTYNSARVFIPIFIVFLIWLYKTELLKVFKEKKLLATYCLLLTAVFFVPMFWQLINPVGQARYSWVSILDEGAVAQINEARVSSKLNPPFARLVNNKFVYFGTHFAKNWTLHYSGSFLFTQGGSNYQFNIPNYGLMYKVNALFLIIGIFWLLKKRDKKAALILGWFYFGSIASGLTREAPHTLRAITMLPSPMIITSVGLIQSAGWLKKKLSINNYLLTILYLVVLGLFLERYLSVYFDSYKRDYSWSWQYGYKDAVAYIKSHYNEYDKIIFTKKYGEPHEFILFYWPWDPQKYVNDSNLIRFSQSNWYWVDAFDKFYFVNDWEIVQDAQNEIQNENNYEFVLESGGTVDCSPIAVDCLLITSPGNYPEGWAKLDTLDFLDKKPAFEILKNI